MPGPRRGETRCTTPRRCWRAPCSPPPPCCRRRRPRRARSSPTPTTPAPSASSATTPRRWWTTWSPASPGSATTASGTATTTPVATGFAFDRDRLAAALGKATGKPVKADKLPVTGFSIRDDGGFEIDLRGTRYLCDADAGGCTEVARKGGEEPGVRSPDGRSEAFIRDWNLWVRDVATGEETRLTTDGSTDYGYATDNAGWTHSDRAILVWSPDSSKIATFQQDQRRTGEMVLVKTVVGHPEVERWKYPLVGDEHVTMIERVVIDVPTRSMVRLQMPPDRHRSTQCDDVSCFGGWEDVQWAPDGRTLAFASSSRDHKDVWLRIADVATGAV